MLALATSVIFFLFMTGFVFAQAAEAAVAGVTVTIGWEVLVALAAVVIIIVTIKAIVDAILDWFRPPPPRPKRRCRLWAQVTRSDGEIECIYNCYRNGRVEIAELTIPLRRINKHLGKELESCPINIIA